MPFTGGRTLRSSAHENSSFSFPFGNTTGIVVFGFTGFEGSTPRPANFSIDDLQLPAQPIPGASAPTLQAFFSDFNLSDAMHTLNVTVGHSDDPTKAFVFSHMMLFPSQMPPHPSSNDSSKVSNKSDSTSIPENPNNTDNAAIVGGVLGGIILLLVGGILLRISLRRRRTNIGNMMTWRRNFSPVNISNGNTLSSFTSSTEILRNRGITDYSSSSSEKSADRRSRPTLSSFGNPPLSSSVLTSSNTQSAASAPPALGNPRDTVRISIPSAAYVVPWRSSEL